MPDLKASRAFIRIHDYNRTIKLKLLVIETSLINNLILLFTKFCHSKDYSKIKSLFKIVPTYFAVKLTYDNAKPDYYFSKEENELKNYMKKNQKKLAAEIIKLNRDVEREIDEKVRKVEEEDRIERENYESGAGMPFKNINLWTNSNDLETYIAIHGDPPPSKIINKTIYNYDTAYKNLKDYLDGTIENDHIDTFCEKFPELGDRSEISTTISEDETQGNIEAEEAAIDEDPSGISPERLLYPPGKIFPSHNIIESPQPMTNLSSRKRWFSCKGDNCSRVTPSISTIKSRPSASGGRRRKTRKLRRKRRTQKRGKKARNGQTKRK